MCRVFLTNEIIANLMTSLADSLEKHTGVDKKWVFYSYSISPKQYQVYLSGEVQYTDDYQGFDDSYLRGGEETSKSIVNEFRFDNSAFLFQCLWRFGLIYSGAGDLGENSYHYK